MSDRAAPPRNRGSFDASLGASARAGASGLIEIVTRAAHHPRASSCRSRSVFIVRFPFFCLGVVCLIAVAATAVASDDPGPGASGQALHVANPGRPGRDGRRRTIIMVWDGLRPDSIDPIDTPNLFALRRRGVNFADNHATYPTFTMMNGASFATGSFPDATGFYGNWFWTPPQSDRATPIPVGRTAAGKSEDYVDPVFTEDYSDLSTLDAYYDDELLLVESLFRIAQAAGLTTVAIGKSGSAYIQDLGRGGLFVDENTVLPQSLATELRDAGFALPMNTEFAYPAGTFRTATSGANPTGRADPLKFVLPNGVQTRDPTDRTQGAPEVASNKYMFELFTKYILPKKRPDLSVIWFRTPDNTQHAYGPGSHNYHQALASQDLRLGELQAALRQAGLDATTNIIVVSDHGHSSVSGPTSLFPLRAIAPGTAVAAGVTDATLGAPDAIRGYSVSGDVRVADLLTHAGFKAYDGQGCQASPMSGIGADGSTVYPTLVDADGSLCGKPGTTYQAISATLPQPVASFKVPATLPPAGIVVVGNGGSDYFYVPDHDVPTIERLVRFLQSREEYGPVFVDSRYGALPGTLALDAIKLENAARKDKGQPDIVATFSWDARQSINGLPGTEFESNMGNRGMHGSFSPIDVHNTMIAAGPGFRKGLAIANPTGNVDLAPTVARLMGLAMPKAEGRVLNEALVEPASTSVPSVTTSVINPLRPAEQLPFRSPLDPAGAAIDPTYPEGTYSIDLVVKDLTVDGRTYRYFDYARAVRH